jgi:hypothetical protein
MTRPVYTKTPESRMAGAERKIRFLERREQVPHGRGANVPYSVSGELEVADGNLRWYSRAKGSVASVHASVGTAPAGSGVTVQVNRNGTSIGTATIAAGGHIASFTPGSPDFAAGDWFTVDITAVGSSTPGSDLVVQLRMAGY